MAIVSVGMLRGNKDALCWQDEYDDVHIGAVLSGRISHCLSSLFSDTQQFKMYYTLEPKWYILDLIDKSKTVKFVLIEFQNWYKTNTENHLNASLRPPLDITKLMVWNNQPATINKDRLKSAMDEIKKFRLNYPSSIEKARKELNDSIESMYRKAAWTYKDFDNPTKQNKEKRMLWKNKSDYAKENMQLKKELEMYDGDVKLLKKALANTKLYHEKDVNEFAIAKAQYEHQVKKLKLELDRALDGSELGNLKKKYETTSTDLKGAKELITKLESQAIYHDLDVNARDRQIENFKDEVISLKEKIATLTDELNAVDGLTKTRELVEIVKSLKGDESGTLDRLLKTIVETTKVK